MKKKPIRMDPLFVIVCKDGGIYCGNAGIGVYETIEGAMEALEDINHSGGECLCEEDVHMIIRYVPDVPRGNAYED
jgi:hypothetical protein